MRLLIYSAVLLLALICHEVESATILALFSSLSYTDHIVFRAYISLLAQKGHSMIVMTPYPGYFSYPETEKIVELDVGQASAPYWDEYKKFITNTDDYHPRLKAFNEFALKLAIAQLKSKQMMALLINPNLRFDLVITEADVPLLYAVAEKYEAPHISITASTGKIHQHESKGDPVQPILFTDVNTLNHGDLMSNWDKIIELYRHVLTKYDYYYNYLPLCEMAAKKLLGLRRPLQEVEYDIDLLFIANNPYLVGNRPVGPAVVFVDRMHIRPRLRLPQHLQISLDSATNGAVYFSLGAIQESEELSASILQTLAEAFRELPFTVLWKIGNTTKFDKPENVITQTWFPQQEVLAHPNVKAFITHGGPRSLEETVFYTVPIIGFPNIKSRKVFLAEVTKFGAGEILNPYKLNKEKVKETISAVVTNIKYKKGIDFMKYTIYEPLVSNPDNAVWWTEYLLRHKSAKHLHAPVVGLTLIRYYLINILLYMYILILLVLYLSILMIRATIRRLKVRIARRQVVVAPGTKFKAL